MKHATYLLVLALFACGWCGTAHGGLTVGDLILTPGETYVDLDGTNAPEAVASWGFPDGSDQDFAVNSNVADDKEHSANEITMTLPGLAANQAYDVDVVIFEKPGSEGGYGVAAGFTSGSLTNYFGTAGTNIRSGGGFGPHSIPIGSTMTNDSGDLVFYLDNFNHRTQIDGVVIAGAKFTDLLLGDVNLDGDVNGLDVDPFVGLVTTGDFQAEGDMNEDGQVNGLDVDPFVAKVVGGGTQQIPEPSTLLLGLLALGVVGGWRKWKWAA